MPAVTLTPHYRLERPTPRAGAKIRPVTRQGGPIAWVGLERDSLTTSLMCFLRALLA